MDRFASVFLFICLSLSLICTSAHSATYEIEGIPTKVTDGDTIKFGKTSLRIIGIDAPEIKQEDGKASRDALYELTKDGTYCEADKTDRYGRWLAICYKRELQGTEEVDIDVNAEMVLQGWAWAYYTNHYREHEKIARQNLEGIWGADYIPVRPSTYRKTGQAAQLRSIAEETNLNSESGNEMSSDECLIKGNINSHNEKIYHLPGSPSYSRTKITPETGELWFCNEAQAIVAGWRQVR